MKWFLRFISICFAVLLFYCSLLAYISYRMYASKSISEAISYRPLFTQLTTPLHQIPYLKERLAFINAALDLASTAAPFTQLEYKNLTLQNIASFQAAWPKLIPQFQRTCQLQSQEPNFIRQKLPSQLQSGCDFINQNEPYLTAASEIVTNLQTILGYNKPMHYVALFQNNMELRPTGGFMGSYADIWINQGKMETFHIQDIYVPDGQIKGYVKEPLPIKKYLFSDNHPGWRLRDANWHPDFTQSAIAIDWFFREGKLDHIDGFLAVNLHPIIDVLKSNSGIYLPDYNLTITQDNFYQEAQRHAEENFFPGSTQKGDFLRSTGNAILASIQSKSSTIETLIPILIKALQQKHFMAYIPGLSTPNWHQLGWDGSLHSYDQDYLMVNEANVGSTKSNCCIDRSLSDAITITNSTITHHLTLFYKNNNAPTPMPPTKWGGGYKNYLRLITPQGISGIEVKLNDKKITELITEKFDSGHMATGFLVQTEGGHESQIEITYSVPNYNSNSAYQLYFQKQSGIDTWPVKFTIHDQEFKDRLNTDKIFETKL